MATMTSFTGLRATSCAAKPRVSAAAAPPAKAAAPVKASFKDLGVAVAATATSAMLVGNAMAVEVKAAPEEGGGVDAAEREEEQVKAGGSKYWMRLDEKLQFDCAPPPHKSGADADEDVKQIRRELVARLMKPW